MSHVTVDGLPRKMYYERSKPNPEKYTNNCPGKKHWQKHHILPCTSVKRSIAAAKKPYLDKALKYFTDWNINKSYNLIPMPTRKAYQVAYGMKGGKSGGVMPELRVSATKKHSDLPCHQPTNWGHTIYNEDVERDLINVWANVSITIKNHKLSANDVKSSISRLITKYKNSLEKGHDPSQANWKAMMSNVPLAHNHFTMVWMPTSPV